MTTTLKEIFLCFTKTVNNFLAKTLQPLELVAASSSNLDIAGSIISNNLIIPWNAYRREG